MWDLMAPEILLSCLAEGLLYSFPPGWAKDGPCSCADGGLGEETTECLASVSTIKVIDQPNTFILIMGLWGQGGGSPSPLSLNLCAPGLGGPYLEVLGAPELWSPSPCGTLIFPAPFSLP